jgi:acyl-coenzyme A thioesterase PaaI-like protein
VTEDDQAGSGETAAGGPGSPRIGPNSPEWASRLKELFDEPPSLRRREMFRVAAAMRDVLHRLTNSSAPTEALTAAAEDLEALAGSFAQYDSASIYEGFAEAANAGGSPHAFFDHSPMIGRANPLAPPIELELIDGVIHGRAWFGQAYEGPPGCVHGGFVAAAFDEVLGSTQSLSGAPGMTGRLTVHYRSPTPLKTELTFIGKLDRVEGRKIFTIGELYAGDRLCAEAEGLFISIQPGKFLELKEQRDAREAESH